MCFVRTPTSAVCATSNSKLQPCKFGPQQPIWSFVSAPQPAKAVPKRRWWQIVGPPQYLILRGALPGGSPRPAASEPTNIQTQISANRAGADRFFATPVVVSGVAVSSLHNYTNRRPQHDCQVEPKDFRPYRRAS